MLTLWDELMCHQLPTTMDHVQTDNPEWTERIYISLYNVTDKDVIVGCGVGQYPNKNVQDGFATVWYQGRQYNFRASRILRPKPHEVTIGPLSIELVEGLKRFRMVLADNPSGIKFDIDWIATMNPHEEEHDFRKSKRPRRAGYLAFRSGRPRARHTEYSGQIDHADGRGLVDPSRPAHGARAVRCAPTQRTPSERLSLPFSSVGRWRSFAISPCIGASSNEKLDGIATSAGNSRGKSVRNSIPGGSSKKLNRNFVGTHQDRCRR